MSTQIATNKSQADRLVACGVAAHTADMSIRTIIEPALCEDVAWHTPMLLTLPYSEANDIYKGDEVNPAWSLSALLGLLPKKIIVDESPYDVMERYGLLIYPFMGGWQVDYQYCENDECHCLKCVHGADLIEACVKTIEWLSAKGYLTK